MAGLLPPSVQLTKMGNTKSIPAFPELSAGSKSLAKSPCPIMRCCLKDAVVLPAAPSQSACSADSSPKGRAEGAPAPARQTTIHPQRGFTNHAMAFGTENRMAVMRSGAWLLFVMGDHRVKEILRIPPLSS